MSNLRVILNVILSICLQMLIFFRVSRMEVLAQVCDVHLANSFELGQNFTDSDIVQTLIDVKNLFKNF